MTRGEFESERVFNEEKRNNNNSNNNSKKNEKKEEKKDNIAGREWSFTPLLDLEVYDDDAFIGNCQGCN